jgi:hypothetical protein
VIRWVDRSRLTSLVDFFIEAIVGIIVFAITVTVGVYALFG